MPQNHVVVTYHSAQDPNPLEDVKRHDYVTFTVDNTVPEATFLFRESNPFSMGAFTFSLEANNRATFTVRADAVFKSYDYTVSTPDYIVSSSGGKIPLRKNLIRQWRELLEEADSELGVSVGPVTMAVSIVIVR